MTHRGIAVDPSRIRNCALLTVEGEHDDISGVGQTEAAHRLCPNIPAERKAHYLQLGVGHYGVFNGSRFRAETAPRIADFMLTNNGRPQVVPPQSQGRGLVAAANAKISVRHAARSRGASTPWPRRGCPAHRPGMTRKDRRKLALSAIFRLRFAPKGPTSRSHDHPKPHAMVAAQYSGRGLHRTADVAHFGPGFGWAETPCRCVRCFIAVRANRRPFRSCFGPVDLSRPHPPPSPGAPLQRCASTPARAR